MIPPMDREDPQLLQRLSTSLRGMERGGRLTVLRVHTQNSLYEVDTDQRRVRRMQGRADPTPRQGEDGQWKTYAQLAVEGGGLLFVWSVEPGWARTTWTSPVIAVDVISEERRNEQDL